MDNTAQFLQLLIIIKLTSRRRAYVIPFSVNYYYTQFFRGKHLRGCLIFLICQLFTLKVHSQESSDCSFSGIGHRGYSNIFPENTLLALEEAFRRGIKYCEVDVSLTSDDVYILFHDESALHRTTDGQGRVDEFSLLEMKALDAGSWKGSQFSGIKIATLAEAALLAEAYDCFLYLDTKDYRPDLLKKIIDETGISPTRLVPSLDRIESAQEFRALIPGGHWVWYNGGFYPDNISDNQFYEDCVALGCVAFEISADLIGNESWNTFEHMVHLNNSLIWGFTVNSNDMARTYFDLKVDGLESDRPWELNRSICSQFSSFFPDSLTTGNWRFSTNLSAFGVGSQLRSVNYQNPPTTEIPNFNTCQNFGVALLNGENVRVMQVPSQSVSNGLLVYSGFSVEDQGAEDHSYTLIMDILIPTASYGKWIAIYQTNTKNVNDADLFITPEGTIGINGEYSGQMEANKWYRLIITVDPESQQIKWYLNGVPVGATTTFGNRWSIFNSSPRGEDQGFLLFTDNDGETADMYISSLQVRDYPLNENGARLLGSPISAGISSSNADLWNLKVKGVPEQDIFLDYDNQNYHVFMPTNPDFENVSISFDLSFGASSDLKSGTAINGFLADSIGLWVTSQDNQVVKKWVIIIHKPLELSNSTWDSNEMKIFPNPVDNILYVEHNMNLNAPISFQLFDLNGRLFVYTIDNESTQSPLALDLSNLQNGIYLYRIEVSDSVKYGKIIIRH